MAPRYDKKYLKELKKYDSKLTIVWDHNKERFAVSRDECGQLHHCFYVQEDDGSFAPIDNRVLETVYTCDLWKNFGGDKEKAGASFYEFVKANRLKKKLKEDQLRKEYLTWYNREHKKEWKAAIENFKSGII